MIILLGVLPLIHFVAPSQADTLGLRVQIDMTSDPSNRSSSYELWFTGEQSETITRRLTITSLSDIAQKLDFVLYDPIVVNGESSIDYTKPGRYQDWFTASPENLILQPGEELTVVLTMAVPADIGDLGAGGILRVLASQAVQSELDTSNTGFQALVTGGAAIDLQFRLGVGAELNLAPDFNIESVQGVLLECGNFLRIFFRNEGTLPIKLAGSLQLSDAVFADRVFGPYEFRTPEIGASQVGYLDIPAEEGIVEGDYTAYVVAEQLGVRETRLFDVYIEYLPPGTLKFWDIAPWGIAGILFAVMMVFGIRLMRGAGPAEPRAAKVPRQPRAPRPAKPPRIAIRRPEPKVEQPILRSYEPPPMPSWYSTPEPAPKPKRFSLSPRVQAKPQVEDPLEALKSAVSRMEKQFNGLNTDFAPTKPPEIRDIALKPKRVPKPKATTPTRNKVDASKLEPEVTTLPKKPAAKKPAAGSAKKS